MDVNKDWATLETVGDLRRYIADLPDEMALRTGQDDGCYYDEGPDAFVNSRGQLTLGH